jgi:hypothetical protein
MQEAVAQENVLATIAEEILDAFSSISEGARLALSQPQGRVDELLSVEGQRFQFKARSDVRDSLERTFREPAIARVVVHWEENGEEILYVSRGSGGGLARPNARLVSYLAPLGRLAELSAGDTEEIALPNARRSASIRERFLLHPTQDESGWDSRDTEAEFTDWRVVIASLRKLIARAARAREVAPEVDFMAQLMAEEEARSLFAQEGRRRTIDRMELRDQPVLDQFQGAVFRAPLEKRTILLGPPGSGKTTTLIRRIAQKTRSEGLTEAEHARLQRYSLEADMTDSWVMFSPTELLKLYVKEAFNREGVSAPNWNLRTWDSERIALGRDVFRFLRGASSGRYTVSPTDEMLSDPSSKGISALFDDFSPEVDSTIGGNCKAALEFLSNSDDAEIRQTISVLPDRTKTAPETVESMHAFADSEALRNRLSGLNSQIDKKSKLIANELLTPGAQDRIRELAELLKDLDRIPDEDPFEEDEEDEAEDGSTRDSRSEQQDELRDRALAARSLLRYVQKLGRSIVEGRRLSSARDRVFQNWIGTRKVSRPQLEELGRLIQLRRHIRTLESAARSLVFGVPRVYARFRRRCLEQGKWFRTGMEVKARSLAPAEVDVLLLVMLRNARRGISMLPDARWLQPVRDRYLVQVMVDEATDFSCVQLAATVELSHPRIRSWLACGDFRQRITRQGISDAADLSWIARVTGVPVDISEITTDYRQTPMLHALAEALATGSPPSKIPDTEDPRPILAEAIHDARLGRWLAQRVLEVERSVGRLPSIAIFVDGDEKIDPLVEAVRSLLAEHNVRIVACHEGRVVGDEQEVRVFDIEYIKGLEFEAVFIVGLDGLATRVPDLFDRYLYVGVTRAATFLGVTCNQQLPGTLEIVRSFFTSSSWA